MHNNSEIDYMILWPTLHLVGGHALTVSMTEHNERNYTKYR